jgi:hypothetical protein
MPAAPRLFSATRVAIAARNRNPSIPGRGQTEQAYLSSADPGDCAHGQTHLQHAPDPASRLLQFLHRPTLLIRG